MPLNSGGRRKRSVPCHKCGLATAEKMAEDKDKSSCRIALPCTPLVPSEFVQGVTFHDLGCPAPTNSC